MGSSKKTVLFILATKDFRDEEFFVTKDILDSYGIKVEAVNETGKNSRGMLGGRVEVERTINDININDYDAIVFCGGIGSAVYFENKKALNIAKEGYLKGKIVCSICLATNILANAGLLRGKKVTGWIDTKKIVESSGGIYTGANVEVCGRIITSQGPNSAEKFGEAIAKALGKAVKEEK